MESAEVLSLFPRSSFTPTLIRDTVSRVMVPEQIPRELLCTKLHGYRDHTNTLICSAAAIPFCRRSIIPPPRCYSAAAISFCRRNIILPLQHYSATAILFCRRNISLSPQYQSAAAVLLPRCNITLLLQISYAAVV